MDDHRPSPKRLQFDAFEVDLAAGQLRRHGKRIKLQEQSFQVLALLLDRPGEVVSREELQAKLWPADTFVDFEHGLNKAMWKLREALGDSADKPRFVETLPRRGYRLIAPVEAVESDRETLASRSHWWRRRGWALALVTLPGALVVLLALNLGGLREQLLGRSAPGEITSIAVLPLKNLSGDPEQEYLAQGLTDAIITELGQIGSLRVISFQSVMRYKQTEKPLPQIAAELSVDAVIEGSALREGDRVRVSAQLVQAKPERHLWSHSYERDLESILALQSEVAREIAQQIKVTLTPEEGKRLARARPVNPEAHVAYLKGRYYWNQRTEEGIKKSLDYFQQAIAGDPNYALAYVGLADSYTLAAERHMVPRSEAEPQIKAAIEKALQLDDSLGEAYTSLAGSDLWWTSETEPRFKRAIELNPNYAIARHWYSVYLSSVGRHQEAILQAKKAVELDPLSPPVLRNLASRFYSARQYDRAVEQAQRTLELYPDYADGHASLGAAYLQKGMYGEGIAAFQKAHTLSRGEPLTSALLADLGYAYAVAGRRTEARKILETIKNHWRQVPISAVDLAHLYVGLGEKEQAFAWLEKAYEQRDPALTYLKAWPSFDPLRSDPRFQGLLRRINLPE